MSKNRKAIPVAVIQVVLHEAGYKCANPSCRNILTLDIHHLQRVADDGADTADNLLPLCGHCHDLHHKKHIPESSVRAWKMLLLALNEAYDRSAIDTILALDKMGLVVRLSGDAVLRLGSLIASGMVAISPHLHKLGNMGMEQTYRADLTVKGKLFVDNWVVTYLRCTRKASCRRTTPVTPGRGPGSRGRSWTTWGRSAATT